MNLYLIWICNMCNQTYPSNDLHYLSSEKYYFSSSFTYCKNCWKIRYSKYYCQYCKFRFQGFLCLKNNIFVCYKCKCSENCGKYCY